MIFGPEGNQGTFSWITDRLPGGKSAQGGAVGDKAMTRVVDA
jgi:hypothetical protein